MLSFFRGKCYSSEGEGLEMNNAVIIHVSDSVVTVTEVISKGNDVRYSDTEKVTAVQDIPIYHKIAIVDIAKGDAVCKYGEKIGVASTSIRVGEHVHSHNLKSERA